MLLDLNSQLDARFFLKLLIPTLPDISKMIVNGNVLKSDADPLSTSGPFSRLYGVFNIIGS